MRSWRGSTWAARMSDAVQLDPSQAAAVQTALDHPYSIITGGAGVGKTTCVRTLVARLEADGRPFRLAASTGKAARRMAEVIGRPACTVHRLLEYGPTPDGHLGFNRDAGRPFDPGVIIVDEASMLDLELAVALFAPLTTHNQLVLVGDANQLPPVGAGRVFADSIESGVVPVGRLTQLHRAAQESWVCTQSRVVLEGRVPDLAPRADFAFHEVSERDDALRAIAQMLTVGLPQRGVHARHVQVLIPQRVGPAGCAVANPMLQGILNPIRESDPDGWLIHKGGPKSPAVTLRLRDRVIGTRNNYWLGVMNGEVGEVVDFLDARSCEQCKLEPAPSSQCRLCAGRGICPPHVVVRYPEGLESRDVYYSRTAASEDLDLAYALTIHKAQGSQWRWVIALVHSTHTQMLTRANFYTAITRAEVGVVIVGDKTGLSRAVANVSDAKRNTGLAPRIVARVKGAA